MFEKVVCEKDIEECFVRGMQVPVRIVLTGNVSANLDVSPLHAALLSADWFLAKTLLSKNCETPIFQYSISSLSFGNTVFEIGFLLSAPKRLLLDLSLKSEIKDSGRSPLHVVAVDPFHVEFEGLALGLVEQGMGVDAVDKSGHTSLSLLLADGHVEFLDFWLSLGASSVGVSDIDPPLLYLLLLDEEALAMELLVKHRGFVEKMRSRQSSVIATTGENVCLPPSGFSPLDLSLARGLERVSELLVSEFGCSLQKSFSMLSTNGAPMLASSLEKELLLSGRGDGGGRSGSSAL